MLAEGHISVSLFALLLFKLQAGWAQLGALRSSDVRIWRPCLGSGGRKEANYTKQLQELAPPDDDDDYDGQKQTKSF